MPISRISATVILVSRAPPGRAEHGGREAASGWGVAAMKALTHKRKAPERRPWLGRPIAVHPASNRHLRHPGFE
jgi:hypothetical protein